MKYRGPAQHKIIKKYKIDYFLTKFIKMAKIRLPGIKNHKSVKILMACFFFRAPVAFRKRVAVRTIFHYYFL